jgi:hypothetical protein
MKITIDAPPPENPNDPFAAEPRADVAVEFDDGHRVTFTAYPRSLLDTSGGGDRPGLGEADFSQPALGLMARTGGTFQITFNDVESVTFHDPEREEDHG